MTNLLLLLAVTLTCVLVNAQAQTSDPKPAFGQTFDEIVVSSDLNVRRKSKENRQGKRLLSNIPTGTTGPPEKPTAVASKLVSTEVTRNKRGIQPPNKRYLDMGVVEFLLKSRKR